MFENVFEQSAQYQATLRERCSCPDFLIIASSIDSTVDVCRRCWYYLGSQAPAVCRATRKDIAIADLVLVSVYSSRSTTIMTSGTVSRSLDERSMRPADWSGHRGAATVYLKMATLSRKRVFCARKAAATAKLSQKTSTGQYMETSERFNSSHSVGMLTSSSIPSVALFATL